MHTLHLALTDTSYQWKKKKKNVEKDIILKEV